MAKNPGLAFRAASAVATGTTSLTISLPAGVADGDLLYLAIGHRSGAYATVPAGWTLELQVLESGVRAEVYSKLASSEPGSYNITGLSTAAIGAIHAFTGPASSGTVVASVSRTAASAAASAPKIDTSGVEHALLVPMFIRGATTIGSVSFGVGNLSQTNYLTRLPDPDLLTIPTRTTGANGSGGGVSLAIGDTCKIVPGDTLGEFRGGFSTGAPTLMIVVAFAPSTSSSAGTTYYPGLKIQGVNTQEPFPAVGTWATGKFFDTEESVDNYQLTQRKGDAGALRGLALATSRRGNTDLLISRFVTPRLSAQTLSGTIDVIFGINTRWKDNTSGHTTESVCKWKLHVYTFDPVTFAVGATLLDNYVDASTLPQSTSQQVTWVGLTSPQSIAGSVAAGYQIAVEIGFRVDAPVPEVTTPPTEWTEFTFWGWGATDNRSSNGTLRSSTPVATDATAGPSEAHSDFFRPTKCSRILFSDTLVEQSAAAAPANATPATAIEIAALPYKTATPFEVTSSPSNARATWHTLVAPETGTLLLAMFGSTGAYDMDIWTATDAADFSTFTVVSSYGDDDISGRRSRANRAVDVVQGTRYYIRSFSIGATATTAPSAGGMVHLRASMQREIAEDDVIVADNEIVVWRDGVIVNFTPDLNGSQPSGVAIDYTKRFMYDLNQAPPAGHEDYRVAVSSFFNNLVEVLDLKTLSRNTFEVDYLSNVFDIDPPVQKPDPLGIWGTVFYDHQVHFAALKGKRDGTAVQLMYGNGFRDVLGDAASLSAFLDGQSDIEEMNYGRPFDMIDGENQLTTPTPGPYTTILPADFQWAAWHGALSEDESVLYFCSGGVYDSYGTPDLTIHRFDLANDVILTPLATLSSAGTNPGLKGMTAVPEALGGGVLVCNGDRVVWVDAAGVERRTFIPAGTWAATLVDVEFSADWSKIWTLDQPSTDLFQFDFESGAQLQRVEQGLGPGNATDFEIFKPTIYPAACVTGPLKIECIDPEDPTLACVGSDDGKGACLEPHDPDKQRIGLINTGLP